MKNRIKIVVTDVDGTLTENPDTYKISLEAIYIIRSLELNGIKTILASGNTIPMIIGLARYIGASGGVVGENGGAIFYRDRVEWFVMIRFLKSLSILKRSCLKSLRIIL
jgi:hydroxymethylpyrimidine pyrophosphatase-like HAD family hydrolase